MGRLQQVFGCDAPVALVTGSGAPRVGRAIAEELARCGCRIALHANQSAGEAQAVAQRLQVEAIVTQGSLEDDDVPAKLVEQTTSAFGRLDILVNSAAIWWPTAIDKITADEARRYFQINALGSFLCARAAAEVMAQQSHGGSIVNIGDWATTRPYLDHVAYFLSKSSIDTLTRALAVEFAQKSSTIRVNCVKPGPVLLGDGVSDQQQQRLAESTLGGRIGTPDDVAHAVRFLCENTFVNGVCLPVDGGRSVFAPDGLQVGENTG